MSFGFSIGDVLALLNLFDRISGMLDEHTGSAHEYQELTMWLSCYRNEIETLDRRVSQMKPDQDKDRDILEVIASSKRSLEALELTRKKYGKSLSQGASRNQLSKSVKKIQWGFKLSPKITGLKNNLETGIRFIRRWIDDRNLPKDLGYPWEGSLDGSNKAVVLSDLYNHPRPLPFREMCVSREAFVGFVQKVLFKDPRLPGSRAVYAGDFEIRDDTDELVTTDNWNQRVYSGANLRMSVILRLPIFPGRKPLGNFCAICRAFCDNSWSGSVPGNDGRAYWKPLHCYHCKSVFRIAFQQPRTTTSNSKNDLRSQRPGSDGDSQTAPMLSGLEEVDRFCRRTLVYQEIDPSDWIKSADGWTKDSPPSIADTMYLMDWVKHTLSDESFLVFMGIVKECVTTKEMDLSRILATISTLFLGHDDLLRVFGKLVWFTLSEIMAKSSEHVDFGMYMEWIVADSGL